jgi:hypothetical protein
MVTDHREALQPIHHVLVVVGDHDFHEALLPARTTLGNCAAARHHIFKHISGGHPAGVGRRLIPAQRS